MIQSSAQHAPLVVVIGGPNGAGKTTAAPRLLRRRLRLVEFLNADLIARGLSPFDPEGVALVASEVLLARMDSLGARGVSFGLESTLAARSLAVRLRGLIARGYEFHLVLLYLQSDDLAVARVADRVRLGGHNVPESTIRRRFRAGLKSFFELYQPIATNWQMYDNSHGGRPILIAAGRKDHVDRVANKSLWGSIQREFDK
ncbi:MAG: zeta toxin family protein [Planctomycetaceae bacterium]